VFGAQLKLAARYFALHAVFSKYAFIAGVHRFSKNLAATSKF
jgi:hypothetical protein